MPMPMTFTRCSLASIAAAMLWACSFDPVAQEGLACAPGGGCPPGQTCVLPQNECWSSPPPDGLMPPGPDARPDGAPPGTPDARDPDAMPRPDASPSSAGLTMLSLSAPAALSPAFDPVTESYSVDVSVLVQNITVTAMPEHPDATLKIQGTSVAPGQTSAPIPLPLGQIEVVVEVTSPDLTDVRSYTLSVTRGAAIVHSIYAKASNTGSGDTLGFGVALSGDVLAVAAPSEDSTAFGVHPPDGGLQNDNSTVDSGAVYVFRRSGASWAQEAFIKASNTDSVDTFGTSLALSGNILAVGAPLEDGNDTGTHPADGGNQSNDTASASGAVYVYRHDGLSWVHEAYIKASNTETGDRFGTSLALSGNILAVGAPREDSNQTGPHPAAGGNQSDNSASASGAVYIYRRSGTSWVHEAYIKASNTGANDVFGTSIALDGNVLAVGAPSESSAEVGVHPPAGGNQGDNSASSSGAAYVYRYDGTSWVHEAYIKASNTGINDAFGTSIGLAGTFLVVGAPFESSSEVGVHPFDGGNQSDGGAVASGAVYAYRHNGTTWVHEAYIKASNTGAFDEFGGSVAVLGDVMAVGALAEDSSDQGVHGAGSGNQTSNDAEDSGAVYVYRREGASWVHEAYVKPSNTSAGDRFGRSVALAGNGMLVGAELEDGGTTGVTPGPPPMDDNASDSGAAYVLQ
jgi:hypothetical protein